MSGTLLESSYMDYQKVTYMNLLYVFTLSITYSILIEYL